MEGLDEYRKGGDVARAIKKELPSKVVEGSLLIDVAKFIEDKIAAAGAKPAFPINISINDFAAHYTPVVEDKTAFAKGDLVKIDFGAHYDGYPVDTAVSILVGEESLKQKLIETCDRALARAIEVAKPGISLATIGKTIRTTMEENGFKPIVNLGGHGLARWDLHAAPSVANHENVKGELAPDTMIAIEPFCTNGVGKVIDSKPSQIFMVLGPRPLRLQVAREALAFAVENFQTLPFCQRWMPKNLQAGLPYLVQAGAVHDFAVLREAGRGLVSQTEQTVYIGERDCEVLT